MATPQGARPLTDLERFERDRLAAAYTPQALRVADQIMTTLPRDEARSVALVGLAVAINGWDRLRPFGRYMRGVIENHIRQAGRDWHWRRHAYQGQPERADRAIVRDETGELMSRVPDRLATAELAEHRTDITRALAVLTDLERSVVLLHGKLGFSLGDVAEQLELAGAEQAKGIWRRALRMMRAELGVPEQAA